MNKVSDGNIISNTIGCEEASDKILYCSRGGKTVTAIPWRCGSEMGSLKRRSIIEDSIEKNLEFI